MVIKNREISTFDLSILYKNLPDHDLVQVLHKFMEFSFNGECNEYRKYLIDKATGCV